LDERPLLELSVVKLMGSWAKTAFIDITKMVITNNAFNRRIENEQGKLKFISLGSK
jgi:hypothetical protein